LEEKVTSRRNFLKYLFLFFLAGSGAIAYYDCNRLSVKDAIRMALGILSTKLNEAKAQSLDVVDLDLTEWEKQKLDENIEKFLDWYYSIGGEIIVMLYIATDIATEFSKEIAEKLGLNSEKIKSLETKLYANIQDRLFDGFLEKSSQEIPKIYAMKMDEFSQETKIIFSKLDKLI